MNDPGLNSPAFILQTRLQWCGGSALGPSDIFRKSWEILEPVANPGNDLRGLTLAAAARATSENMGPPRRGWKGQRRTTRDGTGRDRAGTALKSQINVGCSRAGPRGTGCGGLRMCDRDGMCHRELFGPIHLRASWSLFNYEVPAISFVSSRVTCLHVSGVMRPTPLSPALLRSPICI